MAMAVHDRHQIHAARLHPDINSIGAPNPIWPNVRQITSQVGIDFMHRVLLTDIGLVVDWHQLRQEHKASNMLAPAFVILLLPLPKWLCRFIVLFRCRIHAAFASINREFSRVKPSVFGDGAGAVYIL